MKTGELIQMPLSKHLLPLFVENKASLGIFMIRNNLVITHTGQKFLIFLFRVLLISYLLREISIFLLQIFDFVLQTLYLILKHKDAELFV